MERRPAVCPASELINTEVAQRAENSSELWLGEWQHEPPLFSVTPVLSPATLSRWGKEAEEERMKGREQALHDHKSRPPTALGCWGWRLHHGVEMSRFIGAQCGVCKTLESFSQPSQVALSPSVIVKPTQSRHSRGMEKGCLISLAGPWFILQIYGLFFVCKHVWF